MTDIAYHYLFIMSALLFVLYILHCPFHNPGEWGDTMIPMASGVMEMLMRVGVVMLMPMFFGQESVYYAEVPAWFGADVLSVSAYIYKMGRLESGK